MIKCSRCGNFIADHEVAAINYECEEDDEERCMCEDCCEIYLDRFYSTFDIMRLIGYDIKKARVIEQQT